MKHSDTKRVVLTLRDSMRDKLRKVNSRKSTLCNPGHAAWHQTATTRPLTSAIQPLYWLLRTSVREIGLLGFHHPPLSGSQVGLSHRSRRERVFVPKRKHGGMGSRLSRKACTGCMRELQKTCAGSLAHPFTKSIVFHERMCQGAGTRSQCFLNHLPHSISPLTT